MNNFKKTLVLFACAVLLVAGSVFGTFAYLTDNDSVTNTFTVGQVHLKLDEADVNEMGEKVDEDGNPLADGATEVRTEETQNYHLLPGHTYIKDPTVTVLENSEKAYVRMIVTVNFSEQLDDIFSSPEAVASRVTLDQIFLGYDDDNWKLEKVTENNNNTRTYEFRYKSIVESSTSDTELDALFDSIKVPGFLTNEQLATLVKYKKDDDGKLLKGEDGKPIIEDQFKITVVAHAIQADGFDNADAAWEAFTE